MTEGLRLAIIQFEQYRSDVDIAEIEAEKSFNQFIHLVAKLKLDETRTLITYLDKEQYKIKPSFLSRLFIMHDTKRTPFRKAKIAALIREGRHRSPEHSAELDILISNIVIKDDQEPENQSLAREHLTI